MRSAFFEFNVATTGLFVARGGLDTVAHNVANSSTRGYSRQYVEQRASNPISYRNSRGMIGTGAEIFGVNQYRNIFLDKKYWTQSGVLGEYNAKRTQLSLAENLLSEMSTTGLNASMTDYFSKINDLSTSANDSAYRTGVIQSTNSLIVQMQSSYKALQQQQQDINEEVKITVDIINSLGRQIRDLNEQISLYEVDGSRANDLRDRRALLVDELSVYVNVDVKEVEKNPEYSDGTFPSIDERMKSRKQFDIQINGQDFVKGNVINPLECRERKTYNSKGEVVNTKKNIEDAPGLYDIYWGNSDSKFNIYSSTLQGELKGLIEVRDGNNASYFKSSINRDTTGFSYTQTTNANVLKFKIDDPSSQRLDLSPEGGTIKFTTEDGVTQEYNYSGYKYDPETGYVSIEFTDKIRPSVGLITRTKNVTIGETTPYKGIPYYLSKLNNLVRTLATAFNEGKYMNGKDIPDTTGHVDGFDLNGENTKALFFTYRRPDGTTAKYDAKYDVSQITVENFMLNPDLEDDPDLMAFSDCEPGSGGESNNNVLLGFLNLEKNKSLFQQGGLEDYIIGMVDELAVDHQQAERFTKNYTEITTVVENQRLSYSGVNINEEMVFMIKYQQQYQACSKLISIIDGIYDNTINRMGL